MSDWFVPGEPAVWLGAREKPWKAALAEAIVLDAGAPSARLDLEFTVASFLRAGQPFDLDKMVTPVFEAVLGARFTAVTG